MRTLLRLASLVDCLLIQRCGWGKGWGNGGRGALVSVEIGSGLEHLIDGFDIFVKSYANEDKYNVNPFCDYWENCGPLVVVMRKFNIETIF